MGSDHDDVRAVVRPARPVDAVRGLLLILLVGCGGPSAAAPPPDDAPGEDPPVEEVPPDRLALAEEAIAAGDDEAAARYLRAALTELEPDTEPSWRARARLAVTLSRAGDTEGAREAAGFMCASPDRDMIPPYMPPLLAQLEAANVCTGVCGQLGACCRDYIAEIVRASGTTIDAEQVCGQLESLDPATMPEETCAQILEGWRTGLEAMPNATIPASCR